MNWRQQVKIFADKNVKGSDRSETSGTISYSLTLPSEDIVTVSMMAVTDLLAAELRHPTFVTASGGAL